ncbi:MAG: four helix bundle protein [Bacteroidales bacterium]|jgi:four helix bundle protein|nr:four helix bundle protein [Bacteroidales bacterium]
MTIKKYDIEERLIDFSVNIITFIEKLPNTKSAHHLGNQLLRSGTSPALNYGEAKSAESKNDFIHKMKICLKELRETFVCLKIMERVKDFKNEDQIKQLINESNELISIFVKSVETAQMKQVKH